MAEPEEGLCPGKVELGMFEGTFARTLEGTTVEVLVPLLAPRDGGIVGFAKSLWHCFATQAFLRIPLPPFDFLSMHDLQVPQSADASRRVGVDLGPAVPAATQPGQWPHRPLGAWIPPGRVPGLLRASLLVLRLVFKLLTPRFELPGSKFTTLLASLTP